jgi:hypothetical protein
MAGLGGPSLAAANRVTSVSVVTHERARVPQCAAVVRWSSHQRKFWV